MARKINHLSHALKALEKASDHLKILNGNCELKNKKIDKKASSKKNKHKKPKVV